MAIAPQHIRTFSMADRPLGISNKLWIAMLNQGTVQSSIGDNLPDVEEEFWSSDIEFAAFLDHIKQTRTTFTGIHPTCREADCQHG